MPLLNPKKVKHRKHQKGSVRGVSVAGSELSFGQYGLRALESRWITARQLEAARRAMTRFMQRSGKVWIRVFPDKPVTKKGAEVPMGSGKGAVDHFVAVVRRGRIILEVDGLDEVTTKHAIRLASDKLPVKTAFVRKTSSL